MPFCEHYLTTGSHTFTWPGTETLARFVIRAGGGKGANGNTTRGGAGGGSGQFAVIDVAKTASTVTINVGTAGNPTTIVQSGSTTITVHDGGDGSGATPGAGGVGSLGSGVTAVLVVNGAAGAANDSVDGGGGAGSTSYTGANPGGTGSPVLKGPVPGKAKTGARSGDGGTGGLNGNDGTSPAANSGAGGGGGGKNASGVDGGSGFAAALCPPPEFGTTSSCCCDQCDVNFWIPPEYLTLTVNASAVDYGDTSGVGTTTITNIDCDGGTATITGTETFDSDFADEVIRSYRMRRVSLAEFEAAFDADPNLATVIGSISTTIDGQDPTTKPLGGCCYYLYLPANTATFTIVDGDGDNVAVPIPWGYNVGAPNLGNGTYEQPRIEIAETSSPDNPCEFSPCGGPIEFCQGHKLTVRSSGERLIVPVLLVECCENGNYKSSLTFLDQSSYNESNVEDTGTFIFEGGHTICTSITGHDDHNVYDRPFWGVGLLRPFCTDLTGSITPPWTDAKFFSIFPFTMPDAGGGLNGSVNTGPALASYDVQTDYIRCPVPDPDAIPPCIQYGCAFPTNGGEVAYRYCGLSDGTVDVTP